MTLGRDWRAALHPDPICEVCAESASVMMWHVQGGTREPWQHLCNDCLAAYQAKFPKRKVMTRLVAACKQ